MRLIAGNASGDRNLPEYHMMNVEAAYEEATQLIHEWHGADRLLYALSPRFAPSSSEDHLALMKRLLDEHPDVYLQTHLSENVDEVAWVKKLFPWSKNYLSVYSHFGLVRPRSVFAHGIHISEEEMKELADTQATVSFCPTSNLFLGSGLFKWRKCRDANVRIGIGTDIGAGTSFSLLTTMGEGYKVAQLQGETIHPMEAMYHVTLGGAKALYLDQKIGNFSKGKEADFVVLDLCSTPLLQLRMEETVDIADRLFLLMILGDERNIKETYLMGRRA
jgi:guanine deaminase